jgi:hypothetical protein
MGIVQKLFKLFLIAISIKHFLLNYYFKLVLKLVMELFHLVWTLSKPFHLFSGRKNCPQRKPGPGVDFTNHLLKR